MFFGCAEVKNLGPLTILLPCTLLVNHTSNLRVIFLDRISFYFRLVLNLVSGDPLSASQVVRTTVEYHLVQFFFLKNDFIVFNYVFICK